MSDRAELERRAKAISEHEDQGQINGCGHEYFIGEMCGQCDDIVAALERVQRETAKACMEIIENSDDSPCCFNDRLDIMLKIYRKFGMEY